MAFRLNVLRHVLTVIDGAWWDSWDSGAECPIYYWYKEENDADL